VFASSLLHVADPLQFLGKESSSRAECLVKSRGLLQVVREYMCRASAVWSGTTEHEQRICGDPALKRFRMLMQPLSRPVP
jgi:hypothetical protein